MYPSITLLLLSIYAVLFEGETGRGIMKLL